MTPFIILCLVVLGLLGFGLFFPSGRKDATSSRPDDQPIPAPKNISPPTHPSFPPKLVPAKVEPVPVKPLPPPSLTAVPVLPTVTPEPGPKLITVPPVAQPTITGRTTSPPAPETPPPKPSPAPKLPPTEKFPDFEGFCVACRVNTIAPAKTDFLCEACSVLPEFSVPIKSPISEKSSETSTQTKENSPEPAPALAALDEPARGSADPSVREVPVVSSNIKTVLYHPEYRLLQLRFHDGSVYWYFKVPPQIHKELMEADSKGQFGHNHIYSVFSQKSISNQETQTFWSASQELQMEIIRSLIYAHDLARKDWTQLKTISPNTCPVVVNEGLDTPDVPDEEQESEEEKPSLEELRQISIDAISDPVTDKALVLKDFFGWNDDFFSQADVNFISACLDYDPNEDFDHPSDRLDQCRDLINGYPPSPIKLEVLVWMTRFADKHERFTDANNLLHQVAAILKVFLANQDLEMKERFDFGMAAQELLMDDISETQSDPTFVTDTLFSMLITLGRSDSDRVSIQKRVKRLLKYCKRISQERFTTPSQDPGINKNMEHLKELIEKLNSFQRTVLYSRKDNDDDKI